MPRKTATAKTSGETEVKRIVKKEEVQPNPPEPVEPEEKKPYKVKETLTPHTFVSVKNGFHGKLVYRSPRTREKFVWESFGDEQDIELQELKNAKNAHKSYFERNWFLFDDPEIIHYLGVDKLYASAMTLNEFESLFSKTPEEIKARISTLPDGQRQSVIFKAKQMIATGEIDSMKVVNALEQGLGVELIER